MLVLDEKAITAIEAEQAVVSAILANNNRYDKIGEFLLSEHFSDASCGLVYGVCKSLIDKGKLADIVTVAAELEGKINGIMGYLREMAVVGISIINAEDYAGIIYDRYRKRSFIEAFQEGAESLKDDFSFDFCSFIEGKIEKISELSGQAEVEERTDLHGRALSVLEDKIKNKGKITGVCTGITDFDIAINGLNKGNLYILAGRPGMGKSAFVTSIISNMLIDGKKAGIFSLEMTSDEVYGRILSIRSNIPFCRINKGDIDPHNELPIIHQESQNIKGLYMSDKSGVGLPYIRAVSKRWVKSGCSIIFIDHLSLADLKRDKNSSQNQAISDFTKAMKIMAKDLNIPVVLLSQLNREVEKRDNKRPGLSDLRDSGSIEQDADAVVFFYRSEYYLKFKKPEAPGDNFTKWQQTMDAARGKAELIIAKNRHGPTDVIGVDFNSELMQFADRNSMRRAA